MPSPQQKYLKRLFIALNFWDPAQDKLSSESVMVEADRAIPEFFRKGGIYELMLERHPEFASEDPAVVKAAEEEAIAGFIAELESRLAKARDRLNGNQEVGAVAAKQAVENPDHRWRRDYVLRGEGPDVKIGWDDIGRIHSALRLILNDESIKEGTHWKTHYFNEEERFEGHSYRHYFALIWLASTQEEMQEVPLSCADLSPEALKGAAIEQIIAVLAQCRREHNFDRQHPDWVQTTAPQDAQRCDLGFQGDLLGQMHVYNEHYARTRSRLNVEVLRTTIQDLIIVEFSKLDSEKANRIINTFDVTLTLTEPEVEDTAALNEFINHIKDKLSSLVFSRIDSALTDKEDGLHKLAQHWWCLCQNAADGNQKAIVNKDEVLKAVQGCIELEAESLLLKDDANLASSKYLARFAIERLPRIFEAMLSTSSFDDRQAQTMIITKQSQLAQKVMGLRHCIDSMAIHSFVFGQTISAADKEYYKKLILDCDADLEKMKQEVDQMLASYVAAAQQELAQFGYAAEEGVRDIIKNRTDEFMKPRQGILDDIKEKRVQLGVMREMLSEPRHVKTHVRDYLAPLMKSQLLGSEQNPGFYADYLWALLLEKTPAGEEFIVDADNNVFSDALDIIFGNQKKGIQGLELSIQREVMIEFNKQKKALLPREPAATDKPLLQRKPVVADKWAFTAKYLLNKGIDLAAPENNPTDESITLQELIRNRTSSSSEFQHLAAFCERHPLSLYSATTTPVDPQTHEKAIKDWIEAAKAVFREDPEGGGGVVNFVLQSIMYNLGISQMHKEDAQVIEHIVKQYMGIESYDDNNDYLPFYDSGSEPFSALANHLTLMLTALSSPVVKTSFEAGIIRLMSLKEAAKSVKDKQFIISLSCTLQGLMVTQASAPGDLRVHEIMSKKVQQFTVGGKKFKVDLYPGNELYDLIRTNPHYTAGGTSRVCCSLSDLTEAAYQTRHLHFHRAPEVAEEFIKFNPRGTTGMQATLAALRAAAPQVSETGLSETMQEPVSTEDRQLGLL
jgi:ElaB/YqjD/DUF883 family membrane-anchored ribosome-binding protein